MADIPAPRSYQQILSDIISAFESKFGISTISVGSPLLRIFEASAQSDFRSSNDIFALLRAQDLNQATGQALLLIAASENITPFAESPSSGPVQISDSTFNKIVTKVYQGAAPPIVGSTTIFVQDASLFPTNGSLYIGRGTIDFEGPLSYSGTANMGSFWSISLIDSTQKFHNVGETVILAQGGDRTIQAGTTVQTSQGNTQTAVQFQTLYASIIPDGETVVQNVQAIALSPGLNGNVAAGAINQFVNAPFTGAVVINNTPFANATATESEESLRERIRNVRQSRTQGTPLAITTGVTGVSSVSENKRVVSASIVTRAATPTTLYIDDGTGYEELDEGVAFETLVSSALGGEQYFTVAATPPIAKAFVTSSFVAPFNLVDGCALSAIVSGITYTHFFSADEFNSIGNASAFEVIASINGDFNFPFSARTSESASKVVIYTKQETDETIQITAPSNAVDSNNFFGFPITPVQTTALYKNDRPLSKDGRTAFLTSNPQVQWTSFTGSQTFKINVDNTGLITYTFTDNDFISANTGFTTLNSSNSLAAWAAVFNARVTGVTVTVASDSLVFKSNKGLSANASLEIDSCSLTNNLMFTIPSTQTTINSVGANNDYELDRNRGEIALVNPLNVGDTLTLGTIDTRAFIQSSQISAITLTNDAILYFAVDGNAQIIPTGVTDTSTVAIAAFTLSPPDSSHVRVRITATPTVVGGVFANVLVGDWIVFQDPGFNATNIGAWRVSLVANDFSYVEIVRPTLTNAETVVMTTDGLVFVRTPAYLQRIDVPAGTNYTATSLAVAMANQISGASVEVFKTNFLRIRSNTENGGDIALVAANVSGFLLGLPVSNAVSGVTPDVGYAVSGNPEFGTPAFTNSSVLTPVSTTEFDVTSASAIDLTSKNQLVFLRDLPDLNSAAPYSRYGNNFGYNSAVAVITTNTVVDTRLPVLQEFINKGRFYVASPYSFTGNDSVTILVDGDTVSKRYTVPLFRRVVPTTSTYGITNDFFDVDNGNQVLTAAFGQNFNFDDFALYMSARTKSHAVGGDTTKTILWRWWTIGPGGNANIMEYNYPLSANQGIAALAVETSSPTVASVLLSSGAARTGITVRSTTHIGTIVATSGSNQLITYFVGLSIASASRTSNVTTITADFTGTTATDHGLVNGNVVFIKSTNINFNSGSYVITRTGATTFTYVEAGANVGSTPSIGTISFDSAGEATFTGSTVINGDIIYVKPTSSVNHLLTLPGKSSTLAAQFWKATLPSAVTPTTVITWALLNDPSNLSAYPLNSSANTASAIAVSINTLAAIANSVSPVTAVAVGNGSSANGIIDAATYEDADGSSNPAGYTFTDGAQYIQSQVPPASASSNYDLTFKDGVTSSLTTNSDWQNEDCRLVPLTIVNLVAWFNTLGVTGLSSAAEIIAAVEAHSLQFSTLTPGSAGSLQVQGGTGNQAAGSVITNAVSSGANQIVTIKRADAENMLGGGWFELTNSALTQNPVFTTSSSLDSFKTNSNLIATPNVPNQGVIQVTSPQTLWDYVGGGDLATVFIQIELQGKYTVAAYAGALGSTPFTGLSEGDWIDLKVGSPTPISSRNAGTFRVIRATTTQVWYENPNSTPELGNAVINLLSGTSMMPGDTFTLNSNSYGLNNAGTYTVVASFTTGINGVDYDTITNQVVVSPAFRTNYSGPTVLGPDSALFQVNSNVPDKFTKQLLSLTPNPLNGSLVDLRFDTSYGFSFVNPVVGTVVSALDKLNFNTELSIGTDAYSHAIGLIGAVNQVAYGDETNPTQFPGIIAAGANVNIQGPLIRNISVSLAIRVYTGVDVTDIIEQVKTAVAQYINGNPVGQSIPISELVTAAQSVNGVQSVAIISPTYSSSSDEITLQPSEKSIVSNIDTQISVTVL